MKRYALILLYFLSLRSLLAQVPQGINYQAIAWDGAGPIVNQTVDIRLSIFDGASAIPDYQETHVVLTNEYGLFSLVLGEGTPVSGTFASLDWANIQAVVQTEMDQGSGWSNLGSSPLQSVPYALQAAQVNPFPLDGLSDVSASTPLTSEVLKWDGTAWVSAPDNGTAYTAGVGIGIAGTTISNTGDTNPSDDITTTSIANGDVTGTFNNLRVVGIQNMPVSPIVGIPPDGQALKTVLGQWELVSDTDGDPTNELQQPLLSGFSFNLTNNPASAVQLPQYVQGIGINVTGPVFPGNLYTINNTGDLDPSDDITNSTIAGGDLSGTYPDPTVVALQGIPIASILPTANQVLTYNSATNFWSPQTDRDTVLVTDANGNPRVVGGVNGNGNGFLYVYDSTNTLRAGIRIQGGQGDIFGDMKNFRVQHPTQPEKEIWYASLEGPEAAAYLRGTATLENGKAQIPFPEHFQLIAQQEGMTVLLTPLSGKSRGLAVIEKSLEGFEVVELMEGQGNYAFDWEVKCVRKGHENFEVIRPATSKP